jgi:voltage-gated potassium channel
MTGKLRFLVLILLAVVVIGTVGFWLIEERWSLLDSFYMTIITLSTIGFKEVHPLDDRGRIFTILLVIFGIAAGGYALRTIGQFILEGQLKRYFGRRSMEKILKKLNDHYIVCGFGRVGRSVCQELERNKVPFVVIEQAADLIEEIEKAGYAFINGNCQDDQTLIDARIASARGLINTIANEADAVYVTLSARQLNPNLFIMARADNPSAENKLLKVGATRVLSLHVTAGVRMAQAALRPAVMDFMSVAAEGKSDGLKIEEIAVKKDSKLAGTTLKDSGIRSQLGITVIGAKKKGFEMYYNPPPDFYIEEGDTLILVGQPSQLEKLEGFCGI